LSAATTSVAVVPTANGSRYLQQLCKHWAHNLAVDYDAREGRVTFPKDARGADWPGDALVTMTDGDGALICRIDASAPGQLDRFAFREAPLAFDWVDGVRAARSKS
jgi:hypothetical protein